MKTTADGAPAPDSKLDLKDVTFLIPLQIDSPDRLRNLRHVIVYLTTYFSTRILVGEQGESRLGDALRDLEENFELFNIEPTGPLFQRTVVGNRLLGKVSTPIVSIYDCDMLFPLRQYLYSIQMLRLNAADFIFPYDGAVYDVPETEVERFVDVLLSSQLQSLLEPEATAEIAAEFKMVDRIPGALISGGAFFAHTSDFRKAGGENERFTGWGLDDNERLARITTLGYRIARVPGHSFHLNHARGESSIWGHDYLAANLAEHARIAGMSRATLRREIATWPWTKRNVGKRNAVKM